MNSHTIEDLTSCVLDFQGNMARVIYRKKTTLVEPDVEETHAASLDYIWTNSCLQVETAPDGTTLKWRQLGFASEKLSHEFSETGVLGLDCLVSSAAWKEMGPVDTLCQRNISCSATRTFFPKSYRNRTPGRPSGDVRSHAHPTRSSSFCRNTGVFWLLDVRCLVLMRY